MKMNYVIMLFVWRPIVICLLSVWRTMDFELFDLSCFALVLNWECFLCGVALFVIISTRFSSCYHVLLCCPWLLECWFVKKNRVLDYPSGFRFGAGFSPESEFG